MNLDTLLQALDSDDLEHRLNAIEALAKEEQPAVILRLISLLQDPEPRIRLASARALGELKAEQAVTALTALLNDPDDEVRLAARDALRRIDPTEARKAADEVREEEIVGGEVPRMQPPPQKAYPAVEIPMPPPPAPAAPAPSAVPAAPTGLTEKTLTEEVQFSTYYPREVRPNRWYPLTSYIFKSSAAEAVIADAQRTLGSLMATVRRIVAAARHTIPEGTMITATPYLEGFQFNPSALTIGFYEDWHRLDFKLRAVNAPLYRATNGIMTFTVEGLIVADVPLSVYVGDTSNGNMVTMTQKLYKAIFCSYSHQDKQVIERVERAYKILGFDFLRDLSTLRSGEDWNEGLYALIDKADIFQLFWSASASQSPYVEREWRYALALDRDETNFIRPVYWQQPMPPTPEELQHIHFAYEPALDD